jgi:hypothetical protein
MSGKHRFLRRSRFLESRRHRAGVFELVVPHGFWFVIGMFITSRRLSVIAFSGFLAGGILPLAAELPGLSEKKWLGHFIGFENKKFEYGFTLMGKSAIKVIGAKGLPLSPKLAILVDFSVEETSANGRISIKAILPTSLESTQPAGNEPKNVLIRGKVKGGANYEVTIHENHGLISVGGRLLESGTLVKNPLRFVIRMTVPDPYPYVKKSRDSKQEKAFQDKTKNDQVVLIRPDGKRAKLETDRVIDTTAKEFSGSEITAMEVQFSPYGHKKLHCGASINSSLTLSNKRALPLQRGFTVTWTADLAKDPEGKARLSFQVR